MGNFDDLALAVASFGGHNKVILDDMGKPSIMVGVPKMNYSDIITGGAQETLPWWIVDGVEKSVIWVSKYLNCVVNNRAYSLPMRDPKTHVSFTNALKYCKNKGEGWHMMQNGVFAALSLWSEKNGTIPRGNTMWDASHEKTWERGVNTYIDTSYGSSVTSPGGRTATGSGPITWNHDHSAAGIADLCGNCSEWVGGIRLKEGEIQIIPYGNSMKSDCSMDATSTEWKAIMPDGTLVDPGTAGTLKIDRISSSDNTLRINTSVTSKTTNSSEARTLFKDTGAVAGVSIPKILIAAGLFPDSAQKATGNFRARNNGEQLAKRGSSYKNSEYAIRECHAGMAAVEIASPRGDVGGSDASFRSAYYE